MIRKGLLLLACLWLAGCGSDDRRVWPTPEPALWEVTGEDGARGWLFGTVHALPDGAAWRTPVLETALGDSGLLVVEIAELGEGDGGLFEQVAHTPGQPPLSERVEAGERPALIALMERAGADDGDFSDTESWAAALILSSSVRSSDPANGVDRALLAEAERVAGLESYPEQYALFDTLPEADQADLLAAVAEEAARGSSDAMVEAWLTGDLDALDATSSGGMLDHPGLREVLLVQRNRRWAAEIGAMLANSERPFVAVGAGHMLGEDGLPALLADAGYTLTRIQ